MDDETKRKAFALRQQGKSWRAIAEELHYERTSIAKAVAEIVKGGRKRERLE